MLKHQHIVKMNNTKGFFRKVKMRYDRYIEIGAYGRFEALIQAWRVCRG